MSKTFNNSIIKVKNAEGKFEGLAALRGLDSYELAKANGFTGTEAEWMEALIGDGWIGAYQDVDARVAVLEGSTKLVYSDIAVANDAFVADTTYEYYPYRADIPIEGCTAAMVAEVFYAPAEVFSGAFSSIADTYDGGVYIYSWRVPEEPITIPTIWLWR